MPVLMVIRLEWVNRQSLTERNKMFLHLSHTAKILTNTPVLMFLRYVRTFFARVTYAQNDISNRGMEGDQCRPMVRLGSLLKRTFHIFCVVLVTVLLFVITKRDSRNNRNKKWLNARAQDERVEFFKRNEPFVVEEKQRSYREKFIRCRCRAIRDEAKSNIVLFVIRISKYRLCPFGDVRAPCRHRYKKRTINIYEDERLSPTCLHAHCNDYGLEFARGVHFDCIRKLTAVFFLTFCRS